MVLIINSSNKLLLVSFLKPLRRRAIKQQQNHHCCSNLHLLLVKQQKRNLHNITTTNAHCSCSSTSNINWGVRPGKRIRSGILAVANNNRHRYFSSQTVDGGGYNHDDHDDSCWKEMNEKTRSLANLLLAASAAGSDDHDTDADRHMQLVNSRRGLAQAITMIESQRPSHQHQSNLLLTWLLNHENNHKRKAASFRLGIAGPPGAGKSTFVEAFGKFLLDHHTSKINLPAEPHTMCHKLAVVCIDPSSSVTGGSILGDKTRMNTLSRHDRAYVRPSPTRNVLGGLAAYTEDVVSLCKVGGYDFVIVETVGLGQSEIEVKESVDMLMLMIPPGGGDDLQGIKKGIVEVADLVVVTKADGNLLAAAKNTAADYRGALQMSSSGGSRGKMVLQGWESPPVRLISSHGEDGLEEVWNDICEYRKLMISSGFLEQKRQQQQSYWLWRNVQNLILASTKNDPILKAKAQEVETALREGKTTPRVAASELLESLSHH